MGTARQQTDSINTAQNHKSSRRHLAKKYTRFRYSEWSIVKSHQACIKLVHWKILKEETFLKKGDRVKLRWTFSKARQSQLPEADQTTEQYWIMLQTSELKLFTEGQTKPKSEKVRNSNPNILEAKLLTFRQCLSKWSVHENYTFLGEILV